MVFSIIEILNIILATLIVGYIFTGIVKIKKDNILSLKRFDWDKIAKKYQELFSEFQLFHYFFPCYLLYFADIHFSQLQACN